MLSSRYAQYLAFESSMNIILCQFSWWNYRNIIDRNKMVLPEEMADLHVVTDDGKQKINIATSRVDAKETIVALAGGVLKILE